uniref:Exosome complex component RRP45 n=1 Tax=Arcella intermedia TaxID=1963864 RepID=A0A6B2L532_9EUKA
MVSANEKTFILNALTQNQRIDGRHLMDYRNIKLAFGSEYGTLQVQLGKTRVYVVTSCEVIEPSAEKPTEGLFSVNVHFSPMAAPEYEGGRVTLGNELSRVVERSLRESRAIDTEALCIVAGTKVWSIRLDIHILDNVGNLIDCCSIGAITALHHFRRPDVTIGEEVIIHTKEEREPVPLSIHHIPLCITFGIFVTDVDAILVVDPQWKEEMVMKGRITIILNIHNELCGFHKAGGVPLDVHQILSSVKVASVKVKELTAVISDALKTDLAARGKGKPPKVANALMTTGIGAGQQKIKIDEVINQEKDTSKTAHTFFHGESSVPAREENIRKHVPAAFFSKDAAQRDFMEFSAKYLNNKSLLENEEYDSQEEYAQLDLNGDLQDAPDEQQPDNPQDGNGESEEEEEGGVLMDEFKK